MNIHFAYLTAVAVASCLRDGAGMAAYDGRGEKQFSQERRGDIEEVEVR